MVQDSNRYGENEFKALWVVFPDNRGKLPLEDIDNENFDEDVAPFEFGKAATKTSKEDESAATTKSQ